MKYLLDTNILIYYLNGDEKAIETYRKNRVKMADNIIGSTATLYGLTLVTRNVDDFKKMNLDILNLYENS